MILFGETSPPPFSSVHSFMQPSCCRRREFKDWDWETLDGPGFCSPGSLLIDEVESPDRKTQSLSLVCGF